MVHIGLVFDYSTSYCRGVLRGMKRYAESRQNWVLMPVVSDAKAIRMLSKVKPDGIITWVFRTSLLEILTSLRTPWVNVCGVTPDVGIPRVGPDDLLIGQLAATHLLDRGIRHFGFIGHAEHAGSARREEGFRRTLDQAHHTAAYYHETGRQQFDSRLHRWALGEGFRRWVDSLPKPVGISTFYDMWGLQLSEVCREVGLRVPEDVAIVGMGNDDLLCELARPSLSSVVVPAERIGYEAAVLLDRLMAGAKPPDRPVLLPPTGVAIRQSSDILAIDDPEVAAAIRLIHEHGHQPIRVGDLLRAVSISRRSLERRFRTIFNRSISEEIRRVHLERARDMLAGTELSMSEVAEHAGFSNARHLSIAFRQQTGRTPSAYRQQFRSRP
ncbi:LacI family transcriptional regulator [Singulisphaera sp. GP187]|uniref:AraC family transcriptional regulator n=1 Tax=Singulisphaera sp. GP187 TaxID=1882752 RepID=UPI000926AD2E|nr:xylose operon transcription regulator XylR [Singulisphaera sp. GP187]SIN95489.1 LacI family transcriptional regulator [Singulisphaera sp. GP187]